MTYHDNNPPSLCFFLLGSISESENVSFRGELVTTPNATNHVRASFRVEFARQSCCPVLYFTLDYDVTDALLVDSDSGAAGGGGGGDRKCFNDSMMTRSSFSDRHLWNLSDDVNNDDDDNNGDGGGGGDFRCVTCRRDDTIVCEGRFSKLHGYDAVGNFSVGYPCSDVKHLSLTYSVTLETDVPINCVAISPSDNGPHPYPTCLAYYPRYAKLAPRRTPLSTIGGASRSLCPIEEDTNFIQGGGARGPEIGLEFPLEGTGGTRGEAGIEAAGGDFGQVHHLVSGANQEKAWSTGDIEAGMVTVGMCGGLINDIPTCEELVRNIVGDAEQIIADRLAGILAGDRDSQSTAA